MSFWMELQQTQSQQLTLNQAMLHSLQMLAMPAAELAVFVQEALERNPLLDVDETPREASVGDLPEDAPEPGRDDRPENADASSPEEMPDGERVTSYQAGEASRDVSDWAVAPENEREALLRELRLQLALFREVPEDVRLLALRLLDNLDGRGLFTDSLEELAREHAVPAELAAEAIRWIQQLEPRGIGAFSVAECLLLQLGPEQKLARRLLEEGSDALFGGHLAGLVKDWQVPEEELLEAVREIGRLNPFPLNGLGDGHAPRTLNPDAEIHLDEKGWTYQLFLPFPRLRVVTRYDDKLHQLSAIDRDFIMENRAEARVLVSNLKKRQQTMVRILQWIMEKQRDFFEQGPSAMRPISQKEMAEDLELSESTISRALAEKWIRTDWGLMPMQSFARAPVQTATQPLARDNVTRALREILDAEPHAAPYSDEALRAKLAEKGINVSRRAVNKYRHEMGVGGKSERRKLYRIQDAKEAP